MCVGSGHHNMRNCCGGLNLGRLRTLPWIQTPALGWGGEEYVIKHQALDGETKVRLHK